MEKSFTSSEKGRKRLFPDLGNCEASDSVAKQHLPVGCMVRVEPESNQDSGWRLYAEPEERDGSVALNKYDLNDMAYLDASIIPYLRMAIGTVLIRIPGIHHFELIRNY